MDRELAPAIRRQRLLRRGLLVSTVVVSGSWLYLTVPGWLEPSVVRARVRVERVERGRVEAAVQGAGIVVPAAEVVLASPLDTRVLSVLKRPGDRVVRGDAVVALDDAAARLEVERLERRLEQQRQERDQLELALERDLTALDGSIEIETMELEILAYRADQQQRLFDEGLISDGLRREAEVAARKARVTLDQLRRSRENAERTAETRRRSLELDAAVTASDLEQARRKLERASMRSDRDGVVTWVLDEPGLTVRQGETVARIADLGSFRVEATIADVHAARLAPGRTTHVGLGEHWLEGRVSEVAPAIDNGIARFTVTLDRPDDPSLRSNQRVDVWVVTGARENVLRLAKGPFLQGGEIEQVFVIEGSHAVRSAARIGLVGREHLEIVEGLEAGDDVIVSDLRDRVHLERLVVR